MASFYALFALAERPPVVAHVCYDIACKLAGADALCDALTRSVGPAASHHGSAAWHRSPCLGLCEQAPAAFVTVAGSKLVEQSFGDATPERLAAALRGERLAVVIARGPESAFDCGAFLKRAATASGGRGGGRPERAEGRLPPSAVCARLVAEHAT